MDEEVLQDLFNTTQYLKSYGYYTKSIEEFQALLSTDEDPAYTDKVFNVVSSREGYPAERIYRRF